jgi:UPF0716 family protein affecting phage T7 exclusion
VLLLLLLLLPGRELFMRALRRRGRGVRHAGGAARGVRAGGEGDAGRGEQQRGAASAEQDARRCKRVAGGERQERWCGWELVGE